jgi:hypothetical protein
MITPDNIKAFAARLSPGERKELEHAQLGLADLMCWVQGYRAGEKDTTNHPLGVEESREIHRLLKRILEEADA